MKPLHFALIGENIDYSRSPEIFAAIFKQAGRPGEFDLHSVPPDQLEAGIQQIVRDGASGFAVTIPHKESVIWHLDSIDASARATGAVNSVTVRDGVLSGYNTDCDGFSYTLKRTGLEGCDRAIILGAGGAARAVLYALRREFNIRRFNIWGRSQQKLQDLKRHFQDQRQDVEITTVRDVGAIDIANDSKWLVVNCTPLGGPHYPGASPLPLDFDWRAVALYIDLNYNAENWMVAAARNVGVRAADGSVMLVAQAVRSYELWTGTNVEFEPIYERVFAKR